MRRPSNKPLSTKECFEILGIGKKATLEELKSAYRKRAFELHPDLHPDVPDAARQFQLLNEAYVALSAVLKPGDPDRERERAEAERKERERAEAERVAAERRAQERERARTEAERAAAERREKERERERARMAEKEAREERERERARERMRERVAEGRRRAEEEAARRAAEAGETQEAQEAPGEEAAGEAAAPRGGYAEEEVLRSLLNDPFARRVFEDIYSELNRQKKGRRVGDGGAEPEEPPADAGGGEGADGEAGNAGAQPERPRETPEPRAEKPRERKFWRMPAMRPRTGVRKGGLKTLLEDGVTGWLRKQIDDEQTISMPGSQLVPGSRLRLNIRRGLSGEMVMLEVSLPHDFIPGRPIRLRGMGRQVGPWQGDLYLILTPQ